MDITPERLAKSIFEHPCVRPVSFPLRKSWESLTESERAVLVDRAKIVLADLDPETHLAAAAQKIHAFGEAILRSVHDPKEGQS